MIALPGAVRRGEAGRRSPPGRRARLAALLALALPALPLLAAGCGAAEAGRQRSEGAAVWVDPRAAALDREGRRLLAAAGVEEVFLEAGAVAWDGLRPAVAQVPGAFDGAVPPGTPVTLALRGAAPAGEGLDAERAGRELAGALRELRLRAEAAGLLPVGYHLDLGGGAPPALVRALRAAAGPDLLVSVALGRDRLEERGARELAAAADFVVSFLYGQPPEAPDEPRAWDPEAAAADLAALERLGADYLVGLVVVGGAHRLGSAGDHRDSTTRAGLKPLAREPALRLGIGDSFAGVGRVVHTFEAQRPVRAAGWELGPGEAVQVVRTAPSLVRRLLDRLDAAEPRRRLGELYYRVAAPEEELSLGAPELAAALGRSSPIPDLRPRVVVESIQGDSVVLEIELGNRSRQSTDLAATDGNYLQVRGQGGYFVRVEPGEFSRYTLWRDGREVRAGLAWREPDEVRLYTPMVRGGERIGGAVVELRRRGSGQAAAFVSGRFFLPDGAELEIEPRGGPISRPGILDASPRE